jgi:hypothetical protein
MCRGEECTIVNLDAPRETGGAGGTARPTDLVSPLTETAVTVNLETPRFRVLPEYRSTTTPLTQLYNQNYYCS